MNEAEQLSVELLKRLAKAPEKLDSLRARLGVDPGLLNRAIDVGTAGFYIKKHKSRGRDILLTPTYFAENSDIFADAVAAGRGSHVRQVLDAVRGLQGIPLSIVQSTQSIGNTKLDAEGVNLLIRLAQDGAVKPPSITTTYSGEQFFLFTPTPTGAALAPTKRDIYERAMAIVAAVRQGQFVPRKYRIRDPRALLAALRDRKKLGKATTEATQQYKKLVGPRIAQLVDVGAGYSELRIIDTEENAEALNIACALVESGAAQGVEVDEEARRALESEYEYVESLVASGKLAQREKVVLTQDQQLEIENLFLK